MKQTSLLVFIIAILVISIIGAARRTPAAKLLVTWTAPTQNTDGSPLTDLTGYRIEWGSCTNGTVFGTYQAGVNVGLGTQEAAIYPTNLNPVCIRVFALNAQKAVSAPAYASYNLTPPTLSKPTH